MAKCGLVEKRKGKILPPCPHELSLKEKKSTYECPVHCRGKLRGERAGKRCINHHIKGKHGCRKHGGKAAVGMASPKFKTGEYSRYLQVLSPETAERYKAAQTNPDYLSLAPDIYMIQTRIEELVQRAQRGTGESGQAWENAQAAFNKFMEAQETKSKAATVSALMELRQALDAGNNERAAWDEVQNLWTRLQRTVESERRRALEHGELVQLGIVLSILRTSAEAFRRALEKGNVDESARQTILENVSVDLGRITGGAISGVAIAKR